MTMTYHEQLNSTDDQNKKNKIRKIETIRKAKRAELSNNDLPVSDHGRVSGRIDSIANRMIEEILNN